MSTFNLTRRQLIAALLVFLALAALLVAIAPADSFAAAWQVYVSNLLSGRILP